LVMKIIDDNKLLEMHNEGTMQKDIAAFFKVSPVAISKRLKRLVAVPDILDKYNLTDQQKSFVVEKAKGKTNTQAALESYETTSRKSAKVIGSQLMDNPSVKMAIDELMDHHGLTKSYRVLKLKQHVDNRDPNISLKALDQTFRLDGSYKPEEDKQGNIYLITQYIKEVRKQMDDTEEAIEIEAGN
jgi:phage terminase small subunit